MEIQIWVSMKKFLKNGRFFYEKIVLLQSREKNLQKVRSEKGEVKSCIQFMVFAIRFLGQLHETKVEEIPL